MTPADRIAELEAKLATVQAECDRYYGHLAGLFWSGRIDNLTGDDMQKMADECKADRAKLSRYESVTGLPECPHLLMETLHDLEMIDAEQYINVLLDYAVAMKAEVDSNYQRIREACDEAIRLSAERAVKADAETVSALCQWADAVLLNGRILAERDAAKDALVAMTVEFDLFKEDGGRAILFNKQRADEAEARTEKAEAALATATQDERERCEMAIDDAGGDNTQYHINAIRAPTDEGAR